VLRAPDEDSVRAAPGAAHRGNDKNVPAMLTPKVTQLSAATAHPLKPVRRK
jgi:hypothetical protein